MIILLYQLSYSDHEGVAAVLKIENRQGKTDEQKRQSSGD